MTLFNRSFRLYRIVLLSAFGLAFLLVSLFIASVLDEMPGLEDLENPDTNLATQVYAADGKMIGSYYRHENRVYARLSQLPGHLREALVATEDLRFYSHSGIDFIGLLRAFGVQLSGGRQGGSTITMQLARNLYNEQVGLDRSMARKIKEMIVAAYLERRYTKDEIILHYLNTVPFGSVLYGIQSASNAYFAKSCTELKPEESALLVGMLKGPTAYDPLRHPERAKERRNTVLALMRNQDNLTDEEAERLMAKPLGVKKNVRWAHNSGLAPYFREFIRKELKTWCEKCEVTINHNGRKRCPNMYTDGLRVYTTLDTRLQAHAEAAMRAHMRAEQERFNKLMKGQEQWKKDPEIIRRAVLQSARYNVLKTSGLGHDQIMASFAEKRPMRVFAYNEKGYMDVEWTPMDSIRYYKQFLETGMLAINPENGHVKAWVGGLDAEYFKVDHIAQTKRQVGSTFKPFVYTAAFDNGYTPCTRVDGGPLEWVDPNTGKVWRPKNADGKYPRGKLALRKALAYSVNTVTARLITEKVSPGEVVRYAQKMGIQSEIQAVPSLALGTFELNIMELVNAYATIANQGVWVAPVYITRIEDKFGNVLKRFVPETAEALKPEVAYQVVEALRAVVDYGTAGNMKPQYKVPYELDVAGKTGTTNNNTDAWFMCITPDLAVGAWVGNADQAIHYPTWSVYGQGGQLAMPEVATFLKATYEDKVLAYEKRPFLRPKGLETDPNCTQTVDPDSQVRFFEEEGGSRMGDVFEDEKEPAKAP
jgi:penicillin-binding protein 1A